MDPSRPAPGRSTLGGDDRSRISGADSARYIKDLLESLKGIAVRHDQRVLARLLEAASREAADLAKHDDD